MDYFKPLFLQSNPSISFYLSKWRFHSTSYTGETVFPLSPLSLSLTPHQIGQKILSTLSSKYADPKHISHTPLKSPDSTS